MMNNKEKKIKIGLLGASFNTGNLGVSALTESTIKSILYKWPDAEVILLGSGYNPEVFKLIIKDSELQVQVIPIRFSKNIFIPTHFFVLWIYALLFKILPFKSIREFLTQRNPYVREILKTSLIADITGGDSFSDIYGMRRFILGFLQKWLILFYGKPYVLLPQTYGPYNSHLAKIMAKYVLKKSLVIYSRDNDSIAFLKKILKNEKFYGKAKFVPDVAFILDPRRPDDLGIDPIFETQKKDFFTVGLNISGLLYNGGYTRDNMFNLSVNYHEMIIGIIDYLMSKENIFVILIPHVFTSEDTMVESDPAACKKVYSIVSDKYKNRIFIANNNYNQNEIKYIIGLCDILIGSRMHACIAALSQCIPAVGLAYSKKFLGVFKSVGVENLVIDMTKCSYHEIIVIIAEVIENQKIIADMLKKQIPDAKKKIMNLFKGAPF